MKGMRSSYTKVLVSMGLTAAAVALFGCGSSDVPDDFTAISSRPDPNLVDTGEVGSGPGDYEIFHVSVQKDGKPFGHLYGLKLEVAEPPVPGAPSKDLGLFQNPADLRPARRHHLYRGRPVLHG